MPVYVSRTEPTLYVDKAAAGGGTGTSTSPYNTLTAAKAHLVDRAIGGTLRLRSTTGAKFTDALTWDQPYDLTLEPWDEEEFWYTTGSVSVTSTGLVTMSWAHLLVATGPAVFVGAASGTFGIAGRLIATDCDAETGTSSVWQADDIWTSADLTRCKAHDGGNDGFACDGNNGIEGVMTLTDCESYNNGQEGTSPHTDVVLIIIGGSFHDNGESGMHAINNSVCNISGGAIFEGNGFASEDPDTVGGAGVKYRDNASGVINGAEMTGNHFQGVDLDTTGTVTLTSYNSHDNGTADDIT